MKLIASGPPSWLVATSSLWICLALSTSCNSQARKLLPIKVTVSKTSAKVGEQIYFDLGDMPDGSIGELNINGARYFPIQSQHYPVLVTFENGFRTFSPNVVTVTLKDIDSGLRIAADTQFKVTATLPVLTVSPDSDISMEAGKTGVFFVDGPPGSAWSVSGAPDWITLNGGASGAGRGTVQYTVHPGTSNQARSAVLSIGVCGAF